MTKLHTSRSREWLADVGSDNLTTYVVVYAFKDEPPNMLADAALQIGGDTVHMSVVASTTQEMEEGLATLRGVITALEAFEARVREAGKHLQGS